MVVALCGTLLFLFAPETFWDRSPTPRSRRHPKRPSLFSRRSSARQISRQVSKSHLNEDTAVGSEKPAVDMGDEKDRGSYHEPISPMTHSRHKKVHVGFAPDVDRETTLELGHGNSSPVSTPVGEAAMPPIPRPIISRAQSNSSARSRAISERPGHLGLPTPDLNSSNSPYHNNHVSDDYFRVSRGDSSHPAPGTVHSDTESEKLSFSNLGTITRGQAYTHALRHAPPKSFSQQLRIHHGRLNQDKWWKAAVRPFILFCYPAVLWSAAIYACSIGWLIVISESVAVIYREGSYKFSALSTGLVYISPFIGGVLGTAVAGKVSDIIVRALARRNGGLYEPEFRLVMAAPMAVTTVIGLMGFGWSAGQNDSWIVPTIFFGVVSFGCSLGSTTSITFCVDSYRQYAGEALVTLNFSKNIFHGLVFSLFVTKWLTHDGSKTVFVWIGIIQLIVLLFTIPMYIFGKRARMWTVRKNLMEKF